jgi:lipopolysaccharide transport system permease protein
VSSLKELLAHREVLGALVWRDLKARYRGSVLGFLWTLLNPLLLLTIYSLVFSVYIRVDVPHYPIFAFAGLLPWSWFSSALLGGSTSIVEGGNLIKRVAFPPQVLPAVVVTSTMVNFLLALPLLFAFVLASGLRPGLALLALPLLAVIQYALTLALALALAMVTVRFRDLQHMIANLLTLWFFLTPVLYPVSFVPEAYRPLVALNPMAAVVVGYQDVLYHGRWPAPEPLVVTAAGAAVLTALALLLSDRLRWTLVEQV